MDLKPGTKVATQGFPAVTPETATVCRWNRRINGERMDGWHLIRFDSDGEQVIAHESHLAVVSSAPPQLEAMKKAQAALSKSQGGSK